MATMSRSPPITGQTRAKVPLTVLSFPDAIRQSGDINMFKPHTRFMPPPATVPAARPRWTDRRGANASFAEPAAS